MAFDDGDLYRLVLRGTTSAQEFVTVLHYSFNDNTLGTGPTVEEVGQSLADAFRDDVETTYRALFGTGVTLDPVTVTQEFDPLDPTRVRGSWSAAFTGTAGTRTLSTDQLPTAMTRLHSLRTGSIGRSFRGRIYVPGSTQESDIGSVINTWNAPTGTNFAALADAFVDDIGRSYDVFPPASEDELDWVVYSRTRRAAGLGAYAEEIISTLPRDRVHWLRSRQAGN